VERAVDVDARTFQTQGALALSKLHGEMAPLPCRRMFPPHGQSPMIRALVATTAIALAPCSVALAQQGRDDASFAWSKQLPAGSHVTIRDGNGSIDVRESQTDRVEVRAVKRITGRSSIRDVAFDVKETSDGVMICTVYDGETLCDRGGHSRNIRARVEFTVSIPKSMSLDVSTGNGAVSIDRAGAEVNASTGNGRVTIGETSGRVNASTGNGDVFVEHASGSVRVSTGNGRVFVATSSGPVTASTGNGDIDVRMKTLPDPSNMSFTSGSGTIRIVLPADFNGDVDASTGSGSLNTDFEIQISGRFDPQHMRGRIGKGGPTLRLQTGSGHIELRKG
jgi:Toastrack DUF4097